MIMKIGCNGKNYYVWDIIRTLEADTNLFHIRKLYFDEEAIESNLMRVDIGFKENENWIRATLDINKNHILKYLTEPINMQFQEILQGRIVRFFDDDEEDIDIVLPVDLVADYGRGLIMHKNKFGK
jgi:hypothetical protein